MGEPSASEVGGGAAWDGVRSADPTTLSEPLGPGRAHAVQHHFDLTVDFVGRRLIGYTDVHCQRNVTPPPDGEDWELVLDAASNLQVTDVQIAGASLECSQWCRDEAHAHEVLGCAVRIKLPPGPTGELLVVRVVYETASPGDDGEGGSSALQWLQPSQTAGKVFPYVFSQCQAIHARAMFPCQDTCECKVSYTAVVKCPAELTVLMSALKDTEIVQAEEPDWETPEGCGKEWMQHSFKQPLPVPPYLVAIVCAALDSRRVGPRTQVWSEKEMVDECAWEFADTEQFVAAGERLCGPYSWGIYDLLVLPPSFPYGGMENPCLTFVTPTLLAKDRSQVHVVAHEVSHSWSGNLVTNKTWEHFWLNEGLCVFIELKIIRDVYGGEEASLQLSERLKSLRESVNLFGSDHNFTRLTPDLSGGLDPDDAFSTVPYIKGMSLFCLLESLVGGESKFQPFLKLYFETFKGSTVTSGQLRELYLEYFGKVAAEDPEVAMAMEGPIAALDWTALFTAPGLPEFMPSCNAGPVDEAFALAARWSAAGDDADALAAFSADDVKDWGTTKLTVFLNTLLDDSEHGGGGLTTAGCARMADCYGFLLSNCELRFRFLRMALGARWEGGVEPAKALATSQGRMKFTRPMYRALKAYDTEVARETFLQHRSGYHPICAKMVARDLFDSA